MDCDESRAVRSRQLRRVDTLHAPLFWVAALDLIADEHGRANETPQMLQLEAKKQVVA
jgi:hypothetical protein